MDTRECAIAAATSSSTTKTKKGRIKALRISLPSAPAATEKSIDTKRITTAEELIRTGQQRLDELCKKLDSIRNATLAHDLELAEGVLSPHVWKTHLAEQWPELLSYIRELEAVADAARAYHDPESCYVCSARSSVHGSIRPFQCDLAAALAALDATPQGETR